MQTPAASILPEHPTPEYGTGQAALGHTLRRRHVTMITVGGIIGAGLFVGSSGVDRHRLARPSVISYALAGLAPSFS